MNRRHRTAFLTAIEAIDLRKADGDRGYSDRPTSQFFKYEVKMKYETIVK